MISNNVCKFCNEDINHIENYDLAISDTSQTWDCHHRLETDLNVSSQYLKTNNMYFNRPASELIFLTHSDHSRLHGSPFKGYRHSQESKQKMSESMKGKHHSEETKRKLSEKRQGKQPMKGKHHSEETKRKMSESHKGIIFSEEAKRKMSESHKGKKRGPYKKRKDN